MSGSKTLLLTIAVALGVFLGALDTTMVSTTLPTIVASLGGLSLFSWVFAAYMLTSTVATPIFGTLADLFGCKRLFVAAIGIFLLGSALCGSAQTMAELIAFRAIQGVGAGGLFAVAFTIIGTQFSPVQRPRRQVVLQVMWAVASIVGPGAGGLIVDTIGWRWSFYVNLPIGALATLIVLYALHDAPGDRRPAARVDYVGAALLAAGVTTLLVALMGIGDAAVAGGASVPALLGASAILLLAFLWVERRVAQPILPLTLFANRVFSVGNAAGFLTGLALFGSTGFIPLFVQSVLGGSAMAAGASLTPLSLGWPAGSILAVPLVNRLGYRTVSVMGAAFMVAGFYMLTRLGASSDLAEIALDIFIVGLGMGLITPTVTVAIQNNVVRGQMGAATGAIQFSRSIGGTLGVSAMGALMSSAMLRDTAKAADGGLLDLPAALASVADPQALLQLPLRNQLPEPTLRFLQEAMAQALNGVFLLALIVLAAGVVVAALLPASTPEADMARQQERSAVEIGADGIQRPPASQS